VCDITHTAICKKAEIYEDLNFIVASVAVYLYFFIRYVYRSIFTSKYLSSGTGRFLIQLYYPEGDISSTYTPQKGSVKLMCIL